MKARAVLLPVLLFFFSFEALAQNARSCGPMYSPLSALARIIKHMRSGKTDTTSLRQEKKYVVKAEELQKYLAQLESTYGSRFKNRDKPEPGTRNITATNYMKVVEYIEDGRKLAAKVRFRKYYTRLESDVSGRNLIVSPSLKDRSWLEIKIQHPDYDNVVVKPRLLFLDRDIAKLTKEDFFDHKAGIQSRLLALNPDGQKDIADFMEFFTQMYSSPQYRKEGMLARTEYERTSYSIKMATPSNPDQKIDVQITLDSAVQLTRFKDGKKFNAYDVDDTVVEVKIPLQYSQLSPADMQAIPELSHVKDFLIWLESNHVTKYPMNKGKMSKIEKKLGANEEALDLDYE
jgi:hypothetical protein